MSARIARMIATMMRVATVKNKNRTPLELYVHIPFCVQKCQYCDFLSGPSDQETKNRYIEALLNEILTVQGVGAYEIVSVFIGGGTPSVLEAEAIASIIETIRKKFYFAPEVEITIEANPGTVDLEKLQIYHKAGINRLSLGLQSTNLSELKMLGRIHTYEEFLQSYQWAREAGFHNINIDMMFAVPGQTGEAWREHLYQVAELKPEHISAYSLIIEKGTPFAERELDLPDEDTEYQMYEDTATVLEEYGYHQYEISNYAREGKECRHNVGYWTGTEYLGLGLGASSMTDDSRYSNPAELQTYLNWKYDRPEIQLLTRNDQMEEYMFLGLRMMRGISREQFRERFQVPIESVYGQVLKRLEQQGLLQSHGGMIRLTETGSDVSNYVLAEFLLDG